MTDSMIDSVIASFALYQAQFDGENKSLKRQQEIGRDRFLATGLPTRKLEDWHYTSLKSLELLKLKPAQLFSPGIVSRNDLDLISDDFFNLVFINGQFREDLSDILELNKFLVFTKSSAADESVILQSSHLEALNWAYSGHGYDLKVAKNVKLAKPLQVISWLQGDGLMNHPQLNIELGSGSQLSLIESYSGRSVGGMQNSICHIHLAEKASLDYVHLQAEDSQSAHFATTRVSLHQGSRFDSLSMAIGGKISRHTLSVDILGVGVLATVNGLSLGGADQHMDHHTVISHHSGQSQSTQLYKSVLSNNARSAFTGMVYIAKNSQGAMSEQLNKNLLLSENAEANSRPQLKILADDVKATHGSTVGQLNEEELFYLLSRAIPRETAFEMLSLGFIQDLVFRLPDKKVQHHLNSQLIAAFKSRINQGINQGINV